jgi:outer membrane protein TolC
MKGVLKAIGAAGLLLVAQVAAAGNLTLGQAVDEALSRSPAIAAAAGRQQAALAGEAEAHAGRLPRVEVSESVTRGNNPVFVFGSLLEQGRFAPRNFDAGFLNAPDALTNYRTAVTARVPLYDRLTTTTAIARSRNAVGQAGVELEDTRQRIRADVITRFFGVVVAEERLAVARDAMRSAEADAKATRDRFERGLLVESDALSADVQVATYRQRAIVAAGDLAIARMALATLLQHGWGEVITINETLPTPRFDEPDIDGAVVRALARRAPVKIATFATADAQLHLAAERASMLPRVDALGTLGASGSTAGHRNSDYVAGIAVTLDLFDRARPARIAAARAEVDVARAGDTSARDAVTMEVITAWQRLRVARESAMVACTSVEQARAAARIVRDRYEQGLTTITEQLRAQTVLVSTQFNLLAARYETLIAHAEWLRVTGELDDVQPFL